MKMGAKLQNYKTTKLEIYIYNKIKLLLTSADKS